MVSYSREDEAELVLLCVPDRTISEVAQTIEPGPWIAHVSGATPLAALDPHERRFGLHPLQSFSRARGPEQLDGASAAVTAETDEAREVGFWLARELGLDPFELPDAERALYHAGAAVASNFLVTLHRAAADLVEAAGAPPEALVPLMRRVIENDFELTGPIERGDWEHGRGAPGRDSRTPAAARAALPRPGRRDGGTGAAMKILRTVDRGSRGGRALLRRRPRPDDGRLSRGASLALRGCPEGVGRGRGEPLRQPGAVRRRARTSTGTRATRSATQALAEQAGVDFLFAPGPGEMYPPGFQTWIDVEELGSRLEGEFRPGHFRGVATVCCKLFNIVRPRRAYFGQKDAQQAAVVKRVVADLNLDVEIRVLPTIRDADGLALSTRNAYLSPEEREAALALPRALATKDPDAARELLQGLDVDYVEVAELDGQRVLAAAVRIGKTRLIDNVILEGDKK